MGNRRVRVCLASILSVCLVLLILALVRAAEPKENETDWNTALRRNSLRSLNGVYLTVVIAPVLEKAGITEDMIRTKAELRLRAAGIPILSEKEWLKSTGGEQLLVSLSSCSEKSMYSVLYNVKVWQLMRLERDRGVACFAVTWEEGHVALLGEAQLRQYSVVVTELVDKFANDYLAANQKK